MNGTFSVTLKECHLGSSHDIETGGTIESNEERNS